MPLDQPPDCAPILARVGPMPNYRDATAMRGWISRWDAGNACRRLAEALWPTIADVAAQRRQVRRATFEEGRLAFRIPAVALELGPNSMVTIQVSINNPDRRYTAVLPVSVWEAVTARDAAAEAAQPRLPPPAKDAPPPPICHGWSVEVEGAQAGRAWRQRASECSVQANAPALTYAYELAQLAVNHIAQCANAKAEVESQSAKIDYGAQKPVYILMRCGGRFAPRTLE